MLRKRIRRECRTNLNRSDPFRKEKQPEKLQKKHAEQRRKRQKEKQRLQKVTDFERNYKTIEKLQRCLKMSILKSLKKAVSGKKTSKTSAGGRCGRSSKTKKTTKTAKGSKYGIRAFLTSFGHKPSKDERKANRERLNKSVSGVGGTSFCDDDGMPGNCYLIYLD